MAELHSVGIGVPRRQDDYERAEIFWEQNLEIFRNLGVPTAHAYHALACVSFRTGERDKAQTLFKESLGIFKNNRDRNGVALCLAGLAGVLGLAGKPEQAAGLLGAVELLLESTLSLEPVDQRDLEHCVAIVRNQLDGSAFEQAWGEGRSMTMEKAIAYALENSS